MRNCTNQEGSSRLKRQEIIANRQNNLRYVEIILCFVMWPCVFDTGIFVFKENNMQHLIDKLEKERSLSKKEFVSLISGFQTDDLEYLLSKAKAITKKNFGNGIYTRGLIEISNYCKNDCYYCGIRKSNDKADRYRLSKEEIL